MAVISVGIAFLLVGITLGLFGPGWTWTKLLGGSDQGDLTFSEAYALANSTANPGGSHEWILSFATGEVGPSLGGMLPYRANASFPCQNVTPPRYLSSPVSDVERGRAPNWVVGFVHNGADGGLGLAVVGGHVTQLWRSSGYGACYGSLRPMAWLPASRIVDSPRAAATWAVNLTPFVSEFPDGIAVMTMGIFPGGLSRTPAPTAQWTLQYDACAANMSVLGQSPPGSPYFTAFVNGTDAGHSNSQDTRGLGSCFEPGTLGAQLRFSPMHETNTPQGYAYSAVIYSAPTTLTVSSFAPRIVPALSGAGSAPNVTASDLSLELFNQTGAPLAAYDFSSQVWVTGGDVPLEEWQSILLTSTVPLWPYDIVLVAQPPFTGAVGLQP